MSAADPGPVWSAWSRVTPVAAAGAANARAADARYVRVRIPLGIPPDGAGGYPDLRVIDANAAAVPFAIDPARPHGGDRAAALIDTGFVPHRGTQGVIDLGTSGALVDAVELEIDAAHRPTFLDRVVVDASDDRRTWRIVRDDAIIYRVEQDGARGSTTLTFAPTRSRWLRVRVLDPNAAFPLIGARVTAEASHEPALVVLPLRGVRQDERAGDERFAFAAPVAARVAAVSFSDGGARYARRVTVAASDDGDTWNEIGDATIAHYARGGAQTSIQVGETTARWFRVTIHNGSDAAVAALRPVLLARPHEVVFARGAAPYRLISGNPGVESLSYDLGERLEHETWRASAAQAGATVVNPGYRDPRPIGERKPWLVTGALILVAVLLGAIGLSTVRRPATE